MSLRYRPHHPKEASDVYKFSDVWVALETQVRKRSPAAAAFGLNINTQPTQSLM
jgi:hypothetical protein